VSAPEIESIVLQALRERYPEHAELDDRALVTGCVDTIAIRDAAVEISLAGPTARVHAEDEVESSTRAPAPVLMVSWTPTSKPRREVIVPNGGTDARPIRAETRTTLVRSIALGRRWLQELVDGSAADPDEIAAREGCTKRHVTRMISLASLDPDLVKGAVNGRLPRGIGVTRLSDAPLEWSRQWHMLGVANPRPNQE
jgi:site-specific DNA recombinase